MLKRFALLALALVFSACSESTSTFQAEILGAESMAFRCVTGKGGLPLDGCGCTERTVDEDGNSVLRTMGRVECDCVTLGADGHLYTVDTVKVGSCEPVETDGCITGWKCTPEYDENGNWIPATPVKVGTSKNGSCPAEPEQPITMACKAARSGHIRGYVSSLERGEIAIVDLEGAAKREVLDNDKSVPGMTYLYLNDVLSAVGTHSNGDFTFAVHSSSGQISFLGRDSFLSPQTTLDLGQGTLFDAVVWPPIERTAPMLDIPSRAYISAPKAGLVLELDFDLAAKLVQNNENPDCTNQLDESALILRSFEILPSTEGGLANPSALSVSPDGTTLFVAHATEPAMSVIDLASGEVNTVDLSSFAGCDDSWYTRTLEKFDDDLSCSDGVDNNGDGLIDDADPQCALLKTEAPDPRCPQLMECLDGVDNDLDGLIDLDDPDCADDLNFEGPTPTCSDGIDNDGDGLIDRADPSCLNERGDEEGQPELSTCVDGLDNDGDGLIDLDDPDCTAEHDGFLLEEGGEQGSGVCHDGIDNDGDGLIDEEDPGCRLEAVRTRYQSELVPECQDGIDNDGDGLTDYPEDPGCAFAGDRTESQRTLYGPSDLQTTRVMLDGEAHDFLYALLSGGQLIYVDLNDANRPMSKIEIDGDTPILSYTVRAIGEDATIFAATQDGTLRTISITSPKPLKTLDGLPVYARLKNRNGAVQAYYTIANGTAWQLPDCLFDLSIEVDRDHLPFEISYENGVVDYDFSTATDRVPLNINQGDFRDNGVKDPKVYIAQKHVLLHKEANVATVAEANTSVIEKEPVLRAKNSKLLADPSRFPVFCALEQPTAQAANFLACGGSQTKSRKDVDTDASTEIAEDAVKSEESLCIPEGYKSTGKGESNSDKRARTAYRVSEYAGIEILENDTDRMPAATFTLAYEGTLPGTTRRTGVFGSRTDDSHWSMLDYDADFCELGVEEGDVLIVDLFSAVRNEDALSPECKALQLKSSDPYMNREPRRYRIASVSAHKLELESDTRTTYAPQLQQDDSTALPNLYAPTIAPQEKCANHFIRYFVRAQNEQWLLSSNAYGYRHPWENHNGQCVASQKRIADGRVGRVELGKTFENEWFRFKLGVFREDECKNCSVGTAVPAGAEPHKLDLAYVFDTTPGRVRRRLSNSIILPQQLRWLPADDHLYIIDSGYSTLTEVSGLDTYRQVFEIVRRYF